MSPITTIPLLLKGWYLAALGFKYVIIYILNMCLCMLSEKPINWRSIWWETAGNRQIVYVESLGTLRLQCLVSVMHWLALSFELCPSFISTVWTHSKIYKLTTLVRMWRGCNPIFQLRPELQHNGQKIERYYATGERMARWRIVDRYKRQQEEALETQRAHLKNALEGNL